MIEPKNNSRSISTNFRPVGSLAKDNVTEALSDSAVRIRAYELYELRGRIDGYAKQDWYQAESDLRAN